MTDKKKLDISSGSIVVVPQSLAEQYNDHDIRVSSGAIVVIYNSNRGDRPEDAVGNTVTQILREKTRLDKEREEQHRRNVEASRADSNHRRWNS